MKRSMLCALLALCCASAARSQTTATTADGRTVVLNDDGTWSYSQELVIDSQPIVMAAPPFRETLAPAGAAVSGVKLTVLSSRGNDITDDADWLAANQLALPACEVPNPVLGLRGDCPERAPRAYRDLPLTGMWHSTDDSFLVYGRDLSEGRYLVIADSSLTKVPWVLDFAAYVHSPEYVKADENYIAQRVTWAERDGNVLYVAHAHSTYAASSKGMNAYITAIDLTSLRVLWRSRPLVSNANNFVIAGNTIICGYGFTNEPDYLYTLNRHTGQMMEQIPVKSGPEYIIQKGSRLFVRTYNTDYVFALE